MKIQYVIWHFVLGCVAVFAMSGVANAASQTFTFFGEISDVNNQFVVGAEVSFYKAKNVKRPADFVSNRTGADGKYQVILPEGVYWAFATFRKDGRKFGPLSLDDKHSGEVIEVIVGPDADLELDFVVMDLREAAKKSQKKNEELLRVSGKIVDAGGKPVKLAYALADTVKKFKNIPKYLSAWTDDSGQYLLYLPKGTYYLGASAGFPPDADYSFLETLIIDKDRVGVDLILPGSK